MSNVAVGNLPESGNDQNLSVTGHPSLPVQDGENNAPVVEPTRVFGDDVNSLPDGDGGEEDDETEWSETYEDEYEEEDRAYHYGEEEDDDYHYGEEEDEEDDYEEEEDEVEGDEAPRVFGDNMIDLPDIGGGEEDDGIKQRSTAGCGGEVVSAPEVSECKIGEIVGLSCPICMDAWTNGGDHHICCLPCGHLYGMSCINKWLQHKRGSGKCPQCNAKCGLKDVRKLYPQRIVVTDEEMQKVVKIRLLESRCKALETMVTLVPKRDYHDAHFTSMNGRFDKFDAMQTDLNRGLRGIYDQINYTEQCITALFRHLKIQLPDPPRYPPPSDDEGQ